ncbi:MAG TPA: hypothetical protein DCX89_06165 [Saprospirales bacterium]|nr:hypothetical protein [Saprospirales bacterium]HAY71456.1 hypothetical protein [Saprospirales bacterium]
MEVPFQTLRVDFPDMEIAILTLRVGFPDMEIGILTLRVGFPDVAMAILTLQVVILTLEVEIWIGKLFILIPLLTGIPEPGFFQNIQT